MKRKIDTKEMTLIGLGAALMGVFAQLAIPLPTVPLTLQVFGAILLAVILGAKISSLVMVIYTLLGAIGMPVFANFGRGVGVLVGPTGGYIWGLIALAFIVGKGTQQNNKILLGVGAYFGLLCQYAIGTWQLKVVLNLSLGEAMLAGVYPFILKDIVLTGLAVMIGIQMKKQLSTILRKAIQT